MATYGDIESFQSAQASQAKRKVDVKKPSMEGMQGIQSICSQSPSGKSLKRVSNTQSEKKSQKAMVCDVSCFKFKPWWIQVDLVGCLVLSWLESVIFLRNHNLDQLSKASDTIFHLLLLFPISVC